MAKAPGDGDNGVYWCFLSRSLGGFLDSCSWFSLNLVLDVCWVFHFLLLDVFSLDVANGSEREQNPNTEKPWNPNMKKKTQNILDLKWVTNAENRINRVIKQTPKNDIVLVIRREKIKWLLLRVELGLTGDKRVSLLLGYQKLFWNNLYKLLFNIIQFSVLEFAIENRTEIFGFLYNKTETKLNQNFCFSLVSLKRFFRFVGFLHTLTFYLFLSLFYPILLFHCLAIPHVSKSKWKYTVYPLKNCGQINEFMWFVNPPGSKY